jgi:hypothetical protein
MIPNYNTKMGKMECREYKKVNKYDVSSSRESNLELSEKISDNVLPKGVPLKGQGEEEKEGEAKKKKKPKNK